jgi:uncharacterized protein DUF222
MATELESLRLERLEREIGELAAHIHAATCRWLLLVAEYDRPEGWKEWGALSCGQWLSWRCGIDPRAAREQVRVARRLTELPVAREAFSRGELSYSKVRALCRIATPRTERELVETARHVSAAQLERLVRTYRGVVSTQVEQANLSHDRRYVDWEWDEDGSLVVRARLPAEDGALLIKALEAVRDHLHERRQPEEPPSPEAESAPSPAATTRQPGAGGSAEPPAPDSPTQREEAQLQPSATASNADALVSMAETLLAGGPSDRPTGDRYQIVVHVERDDLVDDSSDGCCEVEDGPALPAETARRLTCDSSVVTITEHDGRPLSVGCKTDETPVARSVGERLCYDIEIEGLLWREGLLRLGWTGSTPEELRRGSAEPRGAGSKVLT